MLSSDGEHWDKASDSGTWKELLGYENGLTGVVWSGERFVAVADLGLIVHSPDGDRWERAIDTVRGGFSGVGRGGGRLVAVWRGERAVAHSGDGDRWERASDIPRVHSLSDVAWGAGRFVAVGSSGWDDGYRAAIVHSLDGDRWELASYPANWNLLSGIAWSGERFVAVGGTIVHSSDGERWEQAKLGIPGLALAGVAWGRRALRRGVLVEWNDRA